MILFANRNRDTDVENKHMDTNWGNGGGVNWKIGSDYICTIDTLYKIDN